MNTMSAFFSGTDDGDDKKGCWFAGVVGQLNKDVCQVKFRFTNYGIFRDVKMDEIFEAESYDLVISDTVPNEWLDKVKGTYTRTASNVSNYPSTQRRGGNNGRQNDFGFGGRDAIDDRLSWMYADMGDAYADDDFWNNWTDDVNNARNRGNAHSQNGRSVSKVSKYKNRTDRIDASKDFYGRTRDDALEAIEDLDYPACHSHLKEIVEAVIGRIKEGISEDTGAISRAQYDLFLLQLAETFAEEFSETYSGEDVETYQIPFIVSCLQQHADWDSLIQIHNDLLDFMGSTYKDEAHMDVAVEYVCENMASLSAENYHKIQEMLRDAQV